MVNQWSAPCGGMLSEVAESVASCNCHQQSERPPDPCIACCIIIWTSPNPFPLFVCPRHSHIKVMPPMPPMMSGQKVTEADGSDQDNNTLGLCLGQTNKGKTFGDVQMIMQQAIWATACQIPHSHVRSNLGASPAAHQIFSSNSVD